MNFRLIPFLFVLLTPALSWCQSCPYETVAGLAATFAGDGAPASEARFYEPSFTLFAPDDSIYISDTGNNRVRRITPDGVVRTVAGDGRPGFGGDGGPAREASLHGPRDLVLGADGSLFIADTENHRVRRVSPDGMITTVVGNGRFSFSGDGGPAVLAAVNRPTSLGIDSTGALFVLDSHNRRVRRIGLDGVIHTVAGSEGTSDYAGSQGCLGSTCFEAGLAVDLPLHQPSSIAVGRDDRIYIAERFAVRRIESDGTLSILTRLGDGLPDGPLDAPTPIEDLYLQGAVFRPAASGDLFLTAQNNPGLFLDPTSNSLRPIATEPLELGIAPSIDRTGSRYAGFRYAFDAPYRFVSVVQGSLGGGETVLTPSPATIGVGDRATAGSLGAPFSVAVGPDGAIFVADRRLSKVLKIGPEGLTDEIAP